uniref:Secreted protein n=1 Tax=Mesocestoides corti TaxID=53468 RepID=A0A5K3G8B3_MESCO
KRHSSLTDAGGVLPSQSPLAQHNTNAWRLLLWQIANRLTETSTVRGRALPGGVEVRARQRLLEGGVRMSAEQTTTTTMTSHSSTSIVHLTTATKASREPYVPVCVICLLHAVPCPGAI